MKELYMLLPLILAPCLMIGYQNKTDKITEEGTAVERPPIIDVHFHAYAAWKGEKIYDWFPQDISYPETDEELVQKTLEVFDSYKIVKIMACGGSIEMWQKAAPGRIIPGVQTG